MPPKKRFPKNSKYALLSALPFDHCQKEFVLPSDSSLWIISRRYLKDFSCKVILANSNARNDFNDSFNIASLHPSFQLQQSQRMKQHEFINDRTGFLFWTFAELSGRQIRSSNSWSLAGHGVAATFVSSSINRREGEFVLHGFPNWARLTASKHQLFSLISITFTLRYIPEGLGRQLVVCWW